MGNQPAVVTFSHLRWNFVYQRPQHLLSRLAHRHPVLFIEEPIFDPHVEPHWEVSTPETGVTVLRPHTQVDIPGFSDEQLPVLRQLLSQHLEQNRIGEHIAWFYTPMALPLIDLLQPKAIVYDCMDELSGFLHAPTRMQERESHLLQLADLVFTGGRSLYQAKKNRNPNVKCFPSSVDREHFAKASTGGPEPADLSPIPHPRLGYCGVIDERLNLDLIRTIAESNPEWQIVMVGPVVKIDSEDLPKAPNIHYLGGKNYVDLPAYLHGWDVCLMPFALNAATKFISPTKTLEYMAARKLIVSTPITDVMEPYGHTVYIGGTPEEFLECCRHALSATPEEKERRLLESDQILASTSWDRTASEMEVLIQKVCEEPGAADSAGPPTGTKDEYREVLVLGAGPTGLSATYHLGNRALLIEQNDRVGGWCRSIVQDGFTFDYAGHIMFSADPYVHQMYKVLLGDNVHWQEREAWIYSKNTYTRYPFQGSLYGLPADVIKECIVGAIEARFGKPGAEKSANGTAKNSPAVPANACSKDASITDCCADGVLESSAPLAKKANGHAANEPRNFEEFIYKVWGAGIAKHFAIPYNRKLWAVPLTEMETSWLGGRVPMPDLEEMIEGALQPKPKPMGPNSRFGYPLQGGFQALMNGFLPYVNDRLLLNSRVVKVAPDERIVTLSDGKSFHYQHLISTLPLPALINAMGNSVPAEIRKAAAALQHVSVRCVNIGVGREALTEKHWIYYPEDTVFHRIFVQGNASPYCNPAGGFGLTCEITYSEHKPLPCDGEQLIQRCIDDCRKVGIFGEDDPVLTANQVDMPYAYVVYNHTRKEAVATIRTWLAQRGITLAGRYSEWEYYNSDHAFIAGKRAAEAIAGPLETKTVERESASGLMMTARAMRQEQ